LPCTDILESLKVLKDREFATAVPIVGRRRRYNNRETKVVVLSLPETCIIQAPSINDVDGIAMKVELCKPSKGFWVELKSSNIEYLRKSILSQLSEGDVVRRSHKRSQVDEPDRVDTCVKNVFWTYERNMFRAVFVCNDETTKKPSTLYTSSKDVAIRFALTGNRPLRAPTQGESDVDGEDEAPEACDEPLFPMDCYDTGDNELLSDGLEACS
jgi:hypothetical protein